MTQTAATIMQDRSGASPPHQRRTADKREPDQTAFAELCSALRVGCGTALIAAGANTSASRAFKPAIPSGSRQRRIEQMTSAAREDARTAPGRGAALSDAAEAKELGGRSQRLGAEKEATTDVRTGRAQESVTAHSKAAAPKATAAQYEGADGLRPDGPGRSGSSSPPGGSTPVPPHGAGEHERASAPSGLGSGAKGMTSSEVRVEAAPPTSARLAAVQRAAAAKPAPTVARQIAQLLNTKLGGSDVARTADTSAMARGNGTPARPSTAAAAGKKADAPDQAAKPGEAARTVFDKLVRNLRMNIGAKQSTARIRLQPPELGHVRVDVKMTDSRIDLRVQVESAIARELIGGRMEILRSALRDHGLLAERIELVEQRPESQTSAAPEDPRHYGDTDQPSLYEGRAEDHGEPTESQKLDGSETPAEPTEESDDRLVTVLDARLDIHI